MASANRAIEIAPRLAFGHAVRATVYRDRLNFRAALSDLAKADALPGDDAVALHNYAILLGQSGRMDEALRMAERATNLDPLNPHSIEVGALVLYYARRYDEAAAMARRALAIAPDRVRVRSILANSLLLQNKSAEAEAEYRKLDLADYRRLVGHASIAARAGDRAGALKHLQVLKQRYGDSAHYQYGQVHAQLGDAENALAELDLALKVRDAGAAQIRVDPLLDPLRRDPRLAVLEAKLNLPSA